MPTREPVLSLAVANINKIDKVDCERLSSLWTVFTKCAEDLENGRRLENLSWRLWYRECRLLHQERPHRNKQCLETAATQDRARTPLLPDDEVPALSASVESAHSSSDTECQMERRALEMTGHKHLTPDRFHELVTLFGQTQDDLQHTYRTHVSERNSGSMSEAHDSEEMPVARSSISPSASSGMSRDCATQDSIGFVERQRPTCSKATEIMRTGSHAEPSALLGARRASSVVHGFNPSPGIVSCIEQCESTTQMADPGPRIASTSMFFIESSPSNSDSEEPSSTTRRPDRLAQSRGRATGPNSRSTGQQSTGQRETGRKMSYRQVVDAAGVKTSPNTKQKARTQADMDYGDSAIVSDDETDDDEDQHKQSQDGDMYVDTEDEVDDDDDDDDWDSVCSESRVNSVHESNLFHKMGTDDDKPVLTSRKSILSALLTNPATKLSNAQSKSSPAITQSRKNSPVETPFVVSRAYEPRTTGDSSSSRAVPTEVPGSISPRTTRRNMLASELSESLRRHLLWERRQKSASNFNVSPAVLQRRHTAHDLTKLHKHPQTSSSSYNISHRPESTGENEFGYNGAGW